MKKFALVFVALIALILPATSVNASEGTLKEVLPSGISGKIEKLIAGTPAGLIGFLDRELPNRIPPIVIGG